MPSSKTLNRQFFTKPAKEKKFFYSFVIVILIGVITGLIALLNVNSVAGYYSIKFLQLLLFFAFGNIYTSSKQNFLKPNIVENAANHILIIAASLCAALIALYSFFKKDVLLMAFGSSAAFLLPLYVKLCWNFFTTIPGKEFNAWFPRMMVSGRASVSLDSFVVRLKLTQYVNDVDEKIYTVFIPHYIKLGDFFSRFLIEHNEYAASAIEDNDYNGSKYAWDFFAIDFYGLQLRRLDPDLPVIDNKIKNQTVVYIKRLKQPYTYLHNDKNLLNETIK